MGGNGIKKNILKLIVFLLLLLIILQLIPPRKIIHANPYLIPKGTRPLVIAHRGASGLHPENTMVAFDGSIEIGVDVLEMDLHITKDGELVVHHDATIDRTSNGSGSVYDFSYDELLEYNFGYEFKNSNGEYPFRDSYVKIPKIDEVFHKYPSMTMIIELKNTGILGYAAGEKLALLITQYNMQDKVMVASFHDDVLNHFNKITNGTISTSTANNETRRFVILNLLFMDFFYSGDGVALQLPLKASGIDLTRKRLIQSIHRRNIALQYWTINNEDDMRRLIKLGADGIMTDYPDILLQVLSEMGY